MKVSVIRKAGAAAQNGTWVPLPEFPGVKIKARSQLSDAWRKRREEILEDLPPSAYEKEGVLTDKAVENLNVELLSSTGIVAWEGIEDEAGAPAPFSKELAVEMLSGPDGALFRMSCSTACARVAELAHKEAEKDTKN